MLRQVRSISAGATKKKKIISRITRKLLMKKEASPTQLQVLEPPVEYLQEDESTATDTRLPPEVAYMLKSIRSDFLQRSNWHISVRILTILVYVVVGFSEFLKNQCFWSCVSIWRLCV